MLVFLIECEFVRKDIFAVRAAVTANFKPNKDKFTFGLNVFDYISFGTVYMRFNKVPTLGIGATCRSFGSLRIVQYAKTVSIFIPFGAGDFRYPNIVTNNKTPFL
jgi:uncharacterized protein (DUF486 family)